MTEARTILSVTELTALSGRIPSGHELQLVFRPTSVWLPINNVNGWAIAALGELRAEAQAAR